MRILKANNDGYKPSNRDKKMSRRKKDELYYGKMAKSWKNKKTNWRNDNQNATSFLEFKQTQRDGKDDQ